MPLPAAQNNQLIECHKICRVWRFFIVDTFSNHWQTVFNLLMAIWGSKWRLRSCSQRHVECHFIDNSKMIVLHENSHAPVHLFISDKIQPIYCKHTQLYSTVQLLYTVLYMPPLSGYPTSPPRRNISLAGTRYGSTGLSYAGHFMRGMCYERNCSGAGAIVHLLGALYGILLNWIEAFMEKQETQKS